MITALIKAFGVLAFVGIAGMVLHAVMAGMQRHDEIRAAAILRRRAANQDRQRHLERLIDADQVPADLAERCCLAMSQAPEGIWD